MRTVHNCKKSTHWRNSSSSASVQVDTILRKFAAAGQTHMNVRCDMSVRMCSYPATPDAGELPDISTQKALVRKKWIFKTKELSALNDRINESYER